MRRAYYGLRDGNRMVCVRDGDFKLSVCLDPTPREGALYDLAADPHELVNLYDRPALADCQARLLSEIITFAGLTPPLGKDD